jgi:hypothetical protein
MSRVGNARSERTVALHRANFEADAVGAAPAGWTAAMTGMGEPRWTVELDDSAPSRSKVVRQSGHATFPLLLRNDSRIKNGFIEARFKAMAGTKDRAAGLVWRARDANNYYVLRANALEDNVVLYKTADGLRRALDIVGRAGGYGVTAAVPSGQWLSLRADFDGNRFCAAFNGKALFQVEDSTFGDAGMVGLWTKADSVTLFDEIVFGALD